MAFAIDSEHSAEVLAQDDAALERHLRRSVGAPGTRVARAARVIPPTRCRSPIRQAACSVSKG